MFNRKKKPVVQVRSQSKDYTPDYLTPALLMEASQPADYGYTQPSYDSCSSSDSYSSSSGSCD